MFSTKFGPKRNWTNISENGENNGQKMIMKKWKNEIEVGIEYNNGIKN